LKGARPSRLGLYAGVLLAGVALAIFVLRAALEAGTYPVGELATRVPERTAMMRDRGLRLHAGVDRRWLPYERISPLLRRAVLIAEDDAFFSHDGFDWNEIRSAARENLEAGRIVRGGSTITQQLARNLYLGDARTLTRKLEEAFVAVRLERALTKRRIFELYLNLIEWGDGIYGAGAAARRYFGVSAEDLNARQALLLACVIINPRRFSPLDPPPRIEKRVRTIAGRMLRRGQLSAAEYRLAVGEPAPLEEAAAPDSTRAAEPGEAAGGAAGTDTAATAAGDTTGQAPPE